MDNSLLAVRDINHKYIVVENWLENLAKKGLFLSTTGFIGPFAKLEKRESGNMHYQIISSLPRTKNDNDMLQMIRDVGWHYVCTEGLADIYATDQIDLEDLHSEADIQWMDVKSMFKYRIVSLILLSGGTRCHFFSILERMSFWLG